MIVVPEKHFAVAVLALFHDVSKRNNVPFVRSNLEKCIHKTSVKQGVQKIEIKHKMQRTEGIDENQLGRISSPEP